MELARQRIPLKKILTPAAIRNSIMVHAACGGSTNLLLHIPAVVHAAGLEDEPFTIGSMPIVESRRL